jgi:hypothetical protein
MTIYNVPVELVDNYQQETLVIRSSDVSSLVSCASRLEPGTTAVLQLLSLRNQASEFSRLPHPVLIDLYLLDFTNEFPLLYNYAHLMREHSLRVTVPVAPGFSKAVNLAGSLSFGVKLEINQPSQVVVQELCGCLDSYLHTTRFGQPVEFFNSLLISFLQDSPVCLWEVMEEDPETYRYVTDDNCLTLSRRLSHVVSPAQIENIIHEIKEIDLDDGTCAPCPCRSYCRGYFKFPQQDYECFGIKRIFDALKSATTELKNDCSKCGEMIEEV